MQTFLQRKDQLTVLRGNFMEICVNVPDELFPRLQRHRNRLVQILSLGLRELEARPSGSFAGLTDVC